MKLNLLRKEIDNIDLELLKLFKKRLKTARKIALVKKDNKLPILDKNREMNVINALQELGGKMDLDKAFIKNIWRLLLLESKKIQKKEQK